MIFDSPEAQPVSDPGSPETVARLICLRLLDQRARSRAELSIKLAKRGVPEDAANAVLDRFVEVGLIDDGALAVNFAAARHSERRLSARAITTQLRQRGIADETIEVAVSGIDTSSERRAARELVAAKLRRYQDVDPAVATRRLMAMLGRRGYSSSLSFDVVRDALRDRLTDDANFEDRSL